MAAAPPVDVAVVGGGLTGLATAFHLTAAGRSVHLVEAAPRLGGCLRTWKHDEWTFELGPNTVVGGEGGLEELLHAAGLDGDLLAAERQAGNRYLWHGSGDGGQLVVLPRHPLAAVSSPLLSLRGKLRLAREPWVRRSQTAGTIAGTSLGERQPLDESVADFTRRRLGPEALATLVGPLVSGVWAGDPERLSLPHAFPRLAALEREHGSLVRGMVKSRKQARRESGGRDDATSPGRTLLGLTAGFDSLAEHLAAAVRRGGAVDAGRPCRGIHRPAAGAASQEGGRLRVETDGGPILAHRVVLATPAAAAAELLNAVTAGASRVLAEVPHAPVAVVCLGFHRSAVEHPLDGFGFLAPRDRGLRILGCLWPSSIFPGRAPGGHVALTALAGGRTDPEVVDLDDEELVRLVLADLDRAVCLSGEPVVRHLHRWRPGIPQYEVGHGRFADAVRALEEAVPGLILAGSYHGGVSLADRAREARRAADRALNPSPRPPVASGPAPRP